VLGADKPTTGLVPVDRDDDLTAVVLELVVEPMGLPKTGMEPSRVAGRPPEAAVAPVEGEAALNGSVLVGPGDGTGAFSTGRSSTGGIGLVWVSPGEGMGAFSTGASWDLAKAPAPAAAAAPAPTPAPAPAAAAGAALSWEEEAGA
jgi:hypothetical protein